MIWAKEKFLEQQQLQEYLENDLHCNDYLNEYSEEIIRDTKRSTNSWERLKESTFQEWIHNPR